MNESPIIREWWFYNGEKILDFLRTVEIRSRSPRINIPIDTAPAFGGFSTLLYDFRDQSFRLDGTLVKKGWDNYGK